MTISPCGTRFLVSRPQAVPHFFLLPSYFSLCCPPAGSSAKPKFPNDWKTFFQWLEKMAGIFQRLEKFFGSFPMIGKNFRDAFGKQKEQKGQTITTISDNSFLRQLGQHGPTLSRRTAQPGDASQSHKPSARCPGRALRPAFAPKLDPPVVHLHLDAVQAPCG